MLKSLTNKLQGSKGTAADGDHDQRSGFSMADSPMGPAITLNDGTTMPVLFFGNGTALSDREGCKDSRDYVVLALRAGYRGIHNERGNDIPFLLRKVGLKRQDVYVIVQCSSRAPRRFVPGFEATVRDMFNPMDQDYVDMFLLHGPGGYELDKAWSVLEQLQAEGLTKSIGLSNFRAEEIEMLASHWKVPPAINQMEFHPFVAHRPEVRETLHVMRKHHIAPQAYSALMPLHFVPNGPVSKAAEKVAAEKQATPAQVLLAWARQVSGGSVVTRKELRQQEQLESVKVVLSQAELDEIASAGKGVKKLVCRLAGMWAPTGYEGPWNETG